MTFYCCASVAALSCGGRPEEAPGTPRLVVKGGCYPGARAEPTDQILRATGKREGWAAGNRNTEDCREQTDRLGNKKFRQSCQCVSCSRFLNWCTSVHLFILFIICILQIFSLPAMCRSQPEPDRFVRSRYCFHLDALEIVSLLTELTFVELLLPSPQILESLVKYRWGAIPEEQHEGIKNFVSTVIIKLCSDDATYRAQKVIMSKLNLILVDILKHDWPHQWQSFLPELTGASRTSETLCENSMHVLRMLSEEVFDFSRGELTQAKTKELKASLNSEFRLIHELCHFVLQHSQKPELIKATLSALHSYLSWVPLGYVFEGNLVQILLHLFPQQPYRTVALQCLTEVGIVCLL